MTHSPSPARDRLGFVLWLALLVAVGGFVAWRLSQGSNEVLAGSWGEVLLDQPLGEPARKHQLAFLLDEPATLRLVIRNPSGVRGILRMGPPSAAKPVEGLHALDEQWTARFTLDGSSEQTIEQLVLAVGTRLVRVALEDAAPLGVYVERRTWTLPAPQRPGP